MEGSGWLFQQGSPTTKSVCGWSTCTSVFKERGFHTLLDCRPRIETICYKKRPTIKTHAQFKISQHNGHVLCDIFYPMQVISTTLISQHTSECIRTCSLEKHPSRPTLCMQGNGGPTKGNECPNCVLLGYMYL